MVVIPSEKEEQKALVTRCHNEGIMIISIENSLQMPINAILDIVKPYVKSNQLESIKKQLTRLMSILTSKRYSQGLYKGICDLFLPEYQLFIEMKKREGGVVSKEQLECHERLRNYGYTVVVAKGAAEAWKIIVDKKNKIDV